MTDFKCQYQREHTDRAGLYVMVLVAMIASCEAEDRTRKMVDGAVTVRCEVPTPRP